MKNKNGNMGKTSEKKFQMHEGTKVEFWTKLEE